MASKNRLYRVVTPTATHLVEAPNPQRAVAFIARKQIKVDIPASYEVFGLAKAGIEIEVATGDDVSDEAHSAVSQELIPT